MTIEEILNGQTLLVNKPLDWTSFQAVNKIKHLLKREFSLKKIKVGHAGTLDPKATGLLIICLGKSTKNIAEIQNAPKEYWAEIKIGAQTESYDTEKPEILAQNYDHITEDLIKKVLKQFIGEIEQIPPVFSAIKINGKRAYSFAREGINVEIKPRKTHVFFIDDVEINLPFISFNVGCSKGTYIRSLAHDIGQKLGVGAYLTQLKRTKIGNHNLQNASDLFFKADFKFTNFPTNIE